MSPSCNDRLGTLERRLRRTQLALATLILATLGAILVALAPRPAQPDEARVSEELRTRRLVVLDDQGVVRVIIGQDPADTARRSRAAGITIHDRHGHERGGMSTFDDDSVVLALDAPRGVGNPMPDRLGLFVGPDGASHIMLLDNQTRAVSKLHSDGTGAGGVQVFKWDMEAKQVHVKTLTFDGEAVETVKLGDQ